MLQEQEDGRNRAQKTSATTASEPTTTGEGAPDPKRTPNPGNTRKVFYTTCREGMANEYIRRHNDIPPDVCAGLRTAGIAFLSIHKLPGASNVLVLTIETAGSNLNLGRATGPGSVYRQNPVCQKWEVDMETHYHNGWTEMEEIHSSDVEWNRSLGLPLLEE